MNKQFSYLLLAKGKKNVPEHKPQFCCLGCFDSFKECPRDLHQDCFNSDPDKLRQ